ncbi:MAG: YbjN domain-containing protein [Micropruina sp.]
MTMFSNWESNQPQQPPPFNRERWDTILNSLEISFAVDEDDDRFADWEDMRIWFLVEGTNNDLMAIRSMWDVRPPVASYDFDAEALNSWNQDHFWPKASITRGEENWASSATW